MGITRGTYLRINRKHFRKKEIVAKSFFFSELSVKGFTLAQSF